MKRITLILVALAALVGGAALVYRHNARNRDAALWSQAADPVA